MSKSHDVEGLFKRDHIVGRVEKAGGEAHALVEELWEGGGGGGGGRKGAHLHFMVVPAQNNWKQR